MLFMVWAEAAIVRASPLNGSVVLLRHLGRLDEDLAAAAVVVNIVRNQNFLVSMLRAVLEHEDFAVHEDDLGLDFLKAFGADRNGNVVEEIRTNFVTHCSSSPSLNSSA